MAKKKTKLEETSTVDFSNIFQDMQELQEGTTPTSSKKTYPTPQIIDGQKNSAS